MLTKYNLDAFFSDKPERIKEFYKQDKEYLMEGKNILYAAGEDFISLILKVGRPGAADRLESYLNEYSVFLWIREDDTVKVLQAEDAVKLLVEKEKCVTNIPERQAIISVPTFEELFYSLPYELRKRIRRENDSYSGENLYNRLAKIYSREIESLVAYGMYAKKPHISMDLFRKEGRQYVAFFNVSDMELPHNPEEINFHLQNTSQWGYAGAIVITDYGDTLTVSSHH